MPITGERRRVGYVVELDTEQAEAKAKSLAGILRDTFTAPIQLETLAKIDQPIQTATKEAAQLQRELTQIAAVDLSKPAEDLQRQLDELQRDAGRTRDTLERMSFVGGADFDFKMDPAIYGDLFDRIEREFGAAVANALKASGRSFSIGDLNAEFLSERAGSLGDVGTAGIVSEANHPLFKELQEKTRQTTEERAEALRLEIELQENLLEQTRIQKELAQRNFADLDQALDEPVDYDVAGAEENLAYLQDAWAEAGEQTQRLAKEEIELAEELTRLQNTYREQVEAAAEEARKIAQREAGQIVTGGGRPAAASPGQAADVVTQQTALVVKKGSVQNAERLAEAMEKAAAASREVAEWNNRGIDAQRRKDEEALERRKLELRRQSLEVEQELANQTAKRIEDEKRKTSSVQAENKERTEAARRATIEAQTALKAAQTQEAQEKRTTAIVTSELKEREKAHDHFRKIVMEREKRKTAEILENEKRLTAETRAEMARRQRVTGNLSGLARSAAFGIGGALGIYGADQVIGRAYEAGRLGAQQARQAETFNFLAERAETSSRRIIKAVQEASAGTVDETTAMGLAAQLLAQRFIDSSSDVEGATQTLVAYSRRAAQIYTDEQGNFLSTQDVFSRLIKFIREGNKELVDQFGLSNAAIADFLDIDKKGLASAEGAALRYQGVIGLLGEELDRLGVSSASSADEIERAAARTTDAANRIRQAMAGPTADVAEGLADFLDLTATSFGRGSEKQILAALQSIADQSREMAPLMGRLGEKYLENAAAAEKLAETYEYTANAVDAGIPGINAYAEELDRLVAKSVRTGNVSDETAERVAVLEEAIGRAAYSAGMAGDAIALMGMQAGGAVGGIDAAAAAMERLSAATFSYNAAGAYTVKFPGEAPEAAIGPSPRPDTWRPWETERADAWKDIEENLANPYWWKEQALERQRLERETAEKAAEEWAKGAKSAADSYAKELESRLGQVEGLFGTSDVTAEDMKLAELGLYQEKPDEYLRQLRDEVRNGVDYEDVDIQDAARRAGIDPNLPAEMILQLFEQAWSDSSLFAGGANLDLINKEAVQAQLDRIEASESGRQAILEYFGITTANTGTGAVASAAGSAILKELGYATTEEGTEIEPTAGPVVFQNVAASDDAAQALIDDLQSRLETTIGGALTIDTITPGETTIADYIAALESQLAEDQTAIASATALGTQIQNYIGAGLIDLSSDQQTGSLLAEFVAALRLDVDTSDEVLAQARGIGLQLQNYIGAGLIDVGAQPGEAGSANSMPAVFLDAIERQFMSEESSTAARAIGNTIKGSIAMGLMDDSTTPAIAADLLYAISDQIYTEDVQAQALAVGTAIISAIHAGWAAGAPELDWIGPIISGAQAQAEEDAADAQSAAAEAAAGGGFTINLPGGQ